MLCISNLLLHTNYPKIWQFETTNVYHLTYFLRVRNMQHFSWVVLARRQVATRVCSYLKTQLAWKICCEAHSWGCWQASVSLCLWAGGLRSPQHGLLRGSVHSTTAGFPEWVIRERVTPHSLLWPSHCLARCHFCLILFVRYKTIVLSTLKGKGLLKRWIPRIRDHQRPFRVELSQSGKVSKSKRDLVALALILKRIIPLY